MRVPPILLLLTLTFGPPGLTTMTAQTPAHPDDVATIDGIIAAFYDVISGPAGAPRQWDRDRTLYMPGARFVSMGMRDGRPVPSIMDHEQYVARTNDFLVRNGFYEEEIHRLTRRFGNVAHVFSTYQFRRTPDGPVEGRGVNSIQLYWDGARWWIAGAIWDAERPETPLSEPFAPPGDERRTP